MTISIGEKIVAPDFLDCDSYDDISNTMLSGSTERFYYPKVSETYSEESKSFPYYMQQFGQIKPDAILFTVKSAIPVADSVRGYYEELGQEIPQLLAINANRSLAKIHALRKLGFESSTDTEFNYQVDNLRDKLIGAKSVVIDQYVASGRTLEMAEDILCLAGVINLAATNRARWYHGVWPEDIDIAKVTSPEHSSFMRSLGREAARSSAES